MKYLEITSEHTHTLRKDVDLYWKPRRHVDGWSLWSTPKSYIDNHVMYDIRNQKNLVVGIRVNDDDED